MIYLVISIHEVHTKYAYKFDKIIVSSSKYN